MKQLSSLPDVSAGDVMSGIDSLMDRIKASPQEKKSFKLGLAELLKQRDVGLIVTAQKELEARERVLVSELQQGDNYTKRARPTVVYAGLLFIFFNYSLVPTIQNLLGGNIEPFALPKEFWLAWGGIVGTWAIGRSAEKLGARNRAVRAITGSSPSSTSLLDDAKG